MIMQPGDELRDYNDNLERAENNLNEVDDFLESAIAKAKIVERTLKIFKQVENSADDVADTIRDMEVIVRLIEKVGPLKAVGKVLKRTLDKMEDTVRKIEKKAKEVDDYLEEKKIKEKVKDARETLERYEDNVELAAADIAGRRIAAQAIEETFDALGRSTYVDALATGVDISVTPANTVIGAANDVYETASNAIKSIDKAIDAKLLGFADQLQKDLAAIAKSVSILKNPLKVINDVLTPVKWALDAVEFVFNTVVNPVLNPILEALGINKLFDRIADTLNDLLPDVFDLTVVEDAIDAALNKLVPSLGLEAFIGFDDLLEKHQAVLDEAEDLLVGDDFDNVIVGTADDDVISGGDGDDTLSGGSGGDDLFIGGKGDDTIIGDGIGDRAVYKGFIGEYSLKFETVGGSDVITVIHDDPEDPLNSEGTDTLTDIEYLVFEGTTLLSSDLKTGLKIGVSTGNPADNVVNGVDPGDVGEADAILREYRDYLFADATSTQTWTLNGGIGDDFMVGSSGADLLDGGDGDDLLDGGRSTGAGRDNFLGGDGEDTVTFQSRTTTGEKIELQSRGVVNLTSTVDSIENIIGSEFADVFLGLDQDSYTERLTGEGGDDLLRGYGGDDLLIGGDGHDILIGDEGENTLVGGAGNDLLIGGTGQNRIDGGYGTDTLSYNAGISSLANTFDYVSGNDDREGWVARGGVFQNSNATGNPGGELLAYDSPSPGIYTTWYLAKPLGGATDHSDKLNGTLAFDWIAQNYATSNGVDVVLVGTEGSIRLITTDPIGNGHPIEPKDWNTVAVSLNDTTPWTYVSGATSATWNGASGNKATNTQIESVLASLTEIRILGDRVNGTGTQDRLAVDNFVLSSVGMPPAISSDFRFDHDGWTGVNYRYQGDDLIEDDPDTASIVPTLLYQSTGGQPDGYIRLNPTANQILLFDAPEKYLGDKSGYYGGTITYGINQISNTNQAPAVIEDIYLRGITADGTELVLYANTDLPSNGSFRTISVSLDTSTIWRVDVPTNGQTTNGPVATAKQIEEVLTNLTGIFVNANYANGAEAIGLDNFTMRAATVPSAAALKALEDMQAESALMPGTTGMEINILEGRAIRLDGNGDDSIVDTFTSIEMFEGSAYDDILLTELAEPDHSVTMRGAAGNDVFYEGKGIQSLFGEAGDDTFVITSVDFDGVETFDGGTGTDTLDLRGVDGVRWRVDHLGVIKAIDAEAEFDNDSDIPYSRHRSIETILGGDGDDKFLGSLNAFGFGGDDFLEALDGGVADGGDGDDHLIYYGFDGATLRGGKGSDQINASGSRTGGSTTVIAGQTGYTPTEDENYNDDDTINYLGGAMSVDGGDGVDMFNIHQLNMDSLSSTRLDLSKTTVQGLNGFEIYLTGIENLAGSTYDDTLIGDNKANLLIGGAGDDNLRGLGVAPTSDDDKSADDSLFGNAGDDELEGGEGDDLLHGGSGFDILLGGNGTDTASYAFNQEVPGAYNPTGSLDDGKVSGDLMGYVDVDLAASLVTAKFHYVLAAEDFDAAPGGWVNNSGAGDTPVNQTSQLTQFLYNPPAFGTGEGLEKVFDLDGFTGPVIVEFDLYLMDGWDGEFLMSRIGNMTFDTTYSNADLVSGYTGGTFSNSQGSVTGTRMIDPVADLGLGTANDSVFHFKYTLDSVSAFGLNIGFYTDFGDGGFGIDNLVISDAAFDVDELTDIENIVGGDLNDRLLGDEGRNGLTGGGGDDYIDGRGGNDVLLDGDGIDTVIGGGGSDKIIAGRASVDWVFGANHRGDFYDGGAGSGDILEYSGLDGSITVDLEAGTVTKTYKIDRAIWADNGGTEARYYGASGEDFPTITPHMIFESTDGRRANSRDDFFRDFSESPTADVASLIEIETRTTSAIDEINGFEKIIGTAGDDTYYATAGVDVFDGGDIEITQDDLDDPDFVPPEDNDRVDFSRSDAAVDIDLRSGSFTGGYAQGDDYTGISDLTGTLFDDVLRGNEDDNSIYDDGGVDVIRTFGGNDRVVLSGIGSRDVHTGDDDDYLFWFDSETADRALQARLGNGNDYVFTNATDFQIFGGDGDDEIEVYGYTTPTLAVETQIVDAGNGDDTLFIGTRMTAIGGAGNDTLYVNDNASVMLMAAGGIISNGGNADGTVYSGFENFQTRNGDDTLLGDRENNILRAGGGNNILEGRRGDDFLVAATGNDVFDGGGGVDTVSFELGTASVLVALGVTAGPNATGGAGTDTLIDIENLIGSSYNDQLDGNDEENRLEGGAGGVDTLNGFGGNDHLVASGDGGFLNGGDDDDTLQFSSFLNTPATPDDAQSQAHGGDGLDSLVVTSGDNVTIDLADTGVQDTGIGTLMVSGLENLQTGDGRDHLFGTSGNNTLRGGADVDQLYGRDGGDTLFGEDGDDSLNGGLDDDVLDGGDGSDTASYADASDAVSVDLGLETAIGADGTDTLISIENAEGGDFDDTLLGNNDINRLWGNAGADLLRGFGGDDTIEAGSGDDRIEGGTGDDILNGENGFDTVSYENATGAVEVNLIKSFASGADGNDTLIGIEGVIGSDNADKIVGGLTANILIGGGGADLIRGKGGDNTVYGGNGADRIFGEIGNERIFGEGGDDRIKSGDGDDYIEGGAGDDRLVSGRGDDTVFGNDGNDTLLGNRDADMLDGGDGDDTLEGDANSDTLFGQDGEDVLVGGRGSDRLSGGNQNDILYGDIRPSDGTLDVGGKDVFIFLDTADMGRDKVRDFENGRDKLDLTDFGFANFAAVSALASMQNADDFKLDLGGGRAIILENFDISQFESGDVIL